MNAEPPGTSQRARWHEVAADDTAEVLMTAMRLAGIEHLWFVSGSELAPLQEAAVKQRALARPAPRLLPMTHENLAMGAACGETMVTRRPTAAAFHIDVGLLNAGGNIHTADRGQYPVLVLSGYPPTAEPGAVPGARDNFIQWVQQLRDQGELVRQYMRWDHKLAPYDNAGLVITRAVQVMLSEPRGPAYLALPREVAVSPAGGSARFPSLEQLRPATLGAGDAAALREAAGWLLEAQQPVICADRLGRNPDAVAPLVALAELLGARLMTTPFRLNAPQSHPLQRGMPSLAPLPPEADCVLVVDTIVPWMPGQHEPGPAARILRLDVDPVVRMTPLYAFPCDLSLVADSARALPALLEAVRAQITPAQARQCAERSARLQEEGRGRLAAAVEAARRDGALEHVTARWASFQLGEALDPETIVVHELGDTSLLNRSLPGTLFGSGGSHIGWGAPAAIGAKVAAPDRMVVCAVGDGSWMFANPQATLWAARYHRAPVLFVIFNNRGYRSGTESLLLLYPEGYAARARDLPGGWFDPPPNYAAEAMASGAYGERVTRPGDVAPALARGLAAVQRDGVPAVLDLWLPKLITGEV